jgi:hypothetical protein
MAVEDAAQPDDDRLVKMLDVQMHWMVHCIGLRPVSFYSLREALIESHRRSSIHVLQRIATASAAITISPGQTQRLWSRIGM